MTNDKVYNLDEVAAIAGLHINTVRKFCREGKIDAKKVGRTWLVSRAGLAKLLPE